MFDDDDDDEVGLDKWNEMWWKKKRNEVCVCMERKNVIERKKIVTGLLSEYLF